MIYTNAEIHEELPPVRDVRTGGAVDFSGREFVLSVAHTSTPETVIESFSTINETLVVKDDETSVLVVTKPHPHALVEAGVYGWDLIETTNDRRVRIMGGQVDVARGIGP